MRKKNPKYGKKHADNVSKALIGRKLTLEHRKNISKGSIPNSGQFKKGQIPYNKTMPNIKICKKCLKVFKVLKYIDRHQKRDFCSKGCATSFRCKGKSMNLKRRIKFSLAKTKEKEFNGFKSPLKRQIRTSQKYLEWRIICLKRDKLKCRICNSDKKLEVHHKKSFKKIIDKFEIKTIEEAFKCEELWNTRNGITLCKNCHIKNDLHRKAANNLNTIKI